MTWLVRLQFGCALFVGVMKYGSLMAQECHPVLKTGGTERYGDQDLRLPPMIIVRLWGRIPLRSRWRERFKPFTVIINKVLWLNWIEQLPSKE